MTTRDDVHRPSVIDPADYEYVAQECMKIEGLGDCYIMQENRRMIQEHMARTGGRYSHHAHGGNCGVCGSVNAIYTVLFYHAKTNTYVRMGQDCAMKCDLGSEEEFSRFRAGILDARDRQAGKAKAQAILADRNLGGAWAIYVADTERTADAPLPPKEEHTVADIVGKLVKYGSASDAQFNFLATLLERIATRPEREAARAAADAAALPVPTGRFEIVGEVLTVKVQESQFGEVVKMLVKHADGWKVWGTVPSSLVMSVDRGSRVKFTATVEASDKDPKFGFFKRPSKAEVLA